MSRIWPRVTEALITTGSTRHTFLDTMPGNLSNVASLSLCEGFVNPSAGISMPLMCLTFSSFLAACLMNHSYRMLMHRIQQRRSVPRGAL